MADITWTNVTDHAPSLSTVDSDVQTDILAYVNDCVNVDMFGGEDSYRLKLARIYLAAHMGELARVAAAGNASSGVVQSETIGASSMSVTYDTKAAASVSSLQSTSYGTQYLALTRANFIGYIAE